METTTQADDVAEYLDAMRAFRDAMTASEQADAALRQAKAGLDAAIKRTASLRPFVVELDGESYLVTDDNVRNGIEWEGPIRHYRLTESV